MFRYYSQNQDRSEGNSCEETDPTADHAGVWLGVCGDLCRGPPNAVLEPSDGGAVGGRLYRIPHVSDKVFKDRDGAVGLGPGFPNDSQHLIGRKVQGLVNDHRTVAAPLTACRPNFWPNEPPR